MAAALTADLEAYPELAGRSLTRTSLHDDTVFFQSNFTPDSTLGEGPLAYVIQANPRAFGAVPLDDAALRGVLGHELAHTLDYDTRVAQRGKLALLELVPLVLSPPSHTWERGTDLVAVDRGFGPGLLRYRTWQFRVLDAEAVADKKRIYYGPLELALLLEVKARCPALFQRFLAQPPTTARQIATHCP